MTKTEIDLSTLKEIFTDCDDIVFHPFEYGKIEGCFIYLIEQVNNQLLIEIEKGISSLLTEAKKNSLEMISAFLNSYKPESSNQKKLVIEEILNGNTVLLIKGEKNAYIFQTASIMKRAIEEPGTEQVLRGPREGFVEDIHTNLMLIRNKLKNQSLKVKYITLGVQTKTKIAIVYLKNIANEEMVQEVYQRVSNIDIDGVLESRYIESKIKDQPFSPFPTVNNTERPDKVCAGLLEGKVAIFTDGTPVALTAPAVFVEFLHSSDDYYNSALFATFIRWIRALGLFVSLILPAFVIAISTIHHDLLQLPLLLRMASMREDLPYPIVVEMFFMLITFELIREAGLRIPKVYGNAAIPILGLVLISQIGVYAGLLGPISTVTVATTALVTYILPNQSFQQLAGLVRIPMIFLAGLFGLMGIIIGLMFILTYLCSLRSFGTPYLSPISPARKEGWKDVFIRAPRWAMETRAPGLGVSNMKRSDDKIPPKHHKKNAAEGNTDEK